MECALKGIVFAQQRSGVVPIINHNYAVSHETNVSVVDAISAVDFKGLLRFNKDQDLLPVGFNFLDGPDVDSPELNSVIDLEVPDLIERDYSQIQRILDQAYSKKRDGNHYQQELLLFKAFIAV